MVVGLGLIQMLGTLNKLTAVVDCCRISHLYKSQRSILIRIKFKVSVLLFGERIPPQKKGVLTIHAIFLL